jgi:hypothetical protein
MTGAQKRCPYIGWHLTGQTPKNYHNGWRSLLGSRGIVAREFT